MRIVELSSPASVADDERAQLERLRYDPAR
jgi:hypothetical protein